MSRHPCTRRKTYVGPRKCLLSGERQEQAGNLVGRGQGLTPGLALKVGRCFRSCYLPPHILNPATRPPSPALPQGHLARPPRKERMWISEGGHPPETKVWEPGDLPWPGVREDLFGAHSSNIPEQSLLPEGGVRGGEDGNFLSPSTWAPKPASQVDVLFLCKVGKEGYGRRAWGSGGHIEAQRARKFSSVGSCFPP